jgi:heat shock protein HslJ
MKVLKIMLLAVILLGGILALNACQSINSPLENYNWILTLWGRGGEQVKLVPDTQITAYFNGKDNTVSGSSGCNQYGGTYKVDGLTLTINKDISITEMFCSDEKNGQEGRFLNALKAATSFKMDHGNLIIYCGMDTLQFKRDNASDKTITKWGE